MENKKRKRGITIPVNCRHCHLYNNKQCNLPGEKYRHYAHPGWFGCNKGIFTIRLSYDCMINNYCLPYVSHIKCQTKEQIKQKLLRLQKALGGIITNVKLFVYDSSKKS